MSNKKAKRTFATLLLAALSIVYVSPLFIILFNSFKSKTFINLQPFTLPNAETFAGWENYLVGIEKYGFLDSVWWSLIITVGSVFAILLFCSMFAWFITRAKTWYSKILFLLCIFSMVVPFQMVMFTLSKTADMLKLNTPWGIVIVYLGFGAGLSVFLFSGFVKGIPLEIEEAATIDGCGPVRTFFRVVLPIMQPTYITVGILQTMWIWNDFLLPYLVLDQRYYKTIPMIIQMMKGSFGRVDMGAVMACLVMAVIPMIVFYLSAQKHIIGGVAAGAVKG
ncbi:MAG: carbohydrate ABC transporter permease [Coriobacteriales bacterium]|jgi:raffinose/stachyose/melibiose transport system permease protein|nr:carbohydrate ABC transporter permease [Coriobacteriales bacterium]